MKSALPGLLPKNLLSITKHEWQETPWTISMLNLFIKATEPKASVFQNCFEERTVKSNTFGYLTSKPSQNRLESIIFFAFITNWSLLPKMHHTKRVEDSHKCILTVNKPYMALVKTHLAPDRLCKRGGDWQIGIFMGSALNPYKLPNQLIDGNENSYCSVGIGHHDLLDNGW